MPGGMLGGLANAAGDAYQTAAGAADHAAGSVDESVARATDDEAGGGLVDGAFGTADHLAGSTDEWVGGATDYLGEGVSGLASLVDRKPGNTAGPGDESWQVAEDSADMGYVPATVKNADEDIDKAGQELGGPFGWLVAHPGYVLGGLAVLYALSVAGPALSLADTATGGGGS